MISASTISQRLKRFTWRSRTPQRCVNGFTIEDGNLSQYRHRVSTTDFLSAMEYFLEFIDRSTDARSIKGRERFFWKTWRCSSQFADLIEVKNEEDFYPDEYQSQPRPQSRFEEFLFEDILKVCLKIV